MTKRNRKSYSDKFRATAVVMLEAAGYPDKEGALTQVGNHLNVPLSTLRGWFTAEHNPPPAELRNEKRFDLQQAIKEELGHIFDAMGKVRSEANYRDLAWAAGVLTDKNQLLDNKPTAILKLQEALESGKITKEQAAERWPALMRQYDRINA